MPEELVTAVVEADPANVALAPLDGAVNVTVTPLIGLDEASVTFACRVLAKEVETVADCGVPAMAAIVVAGAVAVVAIEICQQMNEPAFGTQHR
jgi:hypothetical protein